MISGHKYGLEPLDLGYSYLCIFYRWSSKVEYEATDCICMKQDDIWTRVQHTQGQSKYFALKTRRNPVKTFS